MLQNIRKNIQGTMAKVIVGIIIVPFALFGIESLIGGGGVQNVAEVNGEPISAFDLQQQINLQKRRLMMSMGENIDASMLDDQMLAGPALEAMVQKSLLLQAASEYDLTVAEQKIGELVGGMPAFQTNGQFDPEIYRRAIADQGYSPGAFKQALAEDMLMTQLRTGVALSEFVTPTELSVTAQISEEQRDLRFLVMPLEKYREAVAPDEATISAWYEARSDEYQTQETVELEYIELLSADFVVEVAEDELRERYELEKDSFVMPEQRAVSHILLQAEDGESDEELLARVAEVQALIDAEGSNFAEVAAQRSQDIGSASAGGELGFTTGDSFPEEIEEAVAALALNEVSAAVRSDSGWHFLRVTEIRSGEATSFEEVRAELSNSISQERASVEIIKTVEKLKDRVFNADGLTDPAESLELTVKLSDPITRGQNSGLFANPQLIAAAFTNDVLTEGYNSDVIELAPGHFVVLRVLKHNLPELRPLEDVREAVVAAITEEASKKRISSEAETLLSRLREGAGIETLALEREFDWQVELGARRDSRNISRSLVQRAFELPAPADDTTTFDYVQNDAGDVIVFELVRVTPGDVAALKEAESVALKRRLEGQAIRGIDSRYQKLLRDRAEVIQI